MSEIIKQSMANIWASSGDIVSPDAGKIATGWAVEVVPRQYWNWMQNRTDVNLAYMFQHGIPEWDSTVEYIVNKSYVQYNDVVYKAILTGTNQNPSTATTYWKVAFATSTAALEALKAVTPATDKLPYFNTASTATTTTLSSFARTILDDTSGGAVCTTIGAQPADGTLTALAGVASGINKLPYFDGVDSAVVTDLSAFARTLLDDTSDVTMRATLGLGTAAVATLTTSTTDTTVGRVTKVGDFGLGVELTPIVTNLNLFRTAGWCGYDAAGAGSTNGPAGITYGSVLSCPLSTSGGTQIFYEYSGSRMFTRGLTNSVTWSGWTEVATSANGLFKANNLSDIASPATALANLGVVKQSSATDTTAGRLLTVGAFGVGGLAISTTNFNTITVAGRYFNGNPSDTGLPTADYWELEHLTSHTPTVFSQRAVSVGSGAGSTYTRSTVSGAAGLTPWMLVYTQASVLGAVSQSAGVPTGAIIERGSNANGEYVRWADGTQETRVSIPYTGPVDINSLGGYTAVGTMAHPAAFVASLNTTQEVSAFGLLCGCNTISPQVEVAWFLFSVIPLASVTTTIYVVTKGRWF